MDNNNNLLEAYKTHCKNAQNFLSTRDTTNSIFIASHAFYMPFAFDKHYIFPILGMLLCMAWFVKNLYLTKLNTAKIKVLTEIETQLNIDFYSKEWKYLNFKIFGREISLGKLSLFLPILIFIAYICCIVLGNPISKCQPSTISLHQYFW